MKGLPRLTAPLLALSLLLPQSALAASYPDLPESHWAYASMDRAASLGILTGYLDGSMAPDDVLTWGQYLVMLCRAFYPGDYASALAAGASWDQAGYWAAYDNGLLYDGDFLSVTPGSLSQPLLRQDAAVLLWRVLSEEAVSPSRFGDPEPSAQDLFSDWSDLTQPQQEAVDRLYAAGITKGRTDGTFGGKESIRRADGAVLLLRTMDTVDQARFGQEITVTLHIVDSQGAPLCPDLTAQTTVGRFAESAAAELLEEDQLLHNYRLASYGTAISSFQSAYTVVLQPPTSFQLAEDEFWAAVERGDASYEDYEQQDFMLLAPGENARKRLLLFGDTEKRRYTDKTEAEAHMTTITVPVWRLSTDGAKTASTASFSINAALADDVTAIFTEIFNDPEQFPIRDLGGYDWRGDSAKGEHNCGTAIDINYNENYQVRDGKAIVGSHWKPGEDPYSIPSEGSVVRIFAAHGWSWGGDAWAWDDDQTTGYHDYMHFSYMGT